MGILRAGNIYILSRQLYLKKVPFLPKILTGINRVVFACELHFKADIDKTVRFPHDGLGVVIHEKAKVGKDTKILQHVTIGGNMGKKKLIDGVLTSAPVIGNNVICGTGAKILGPVKIGNYAKIGAGAVVMIDVPDYGVAVGIPAKVVKISNEEKITNTNTDSNAN
ncbi:serine O-acetyltransferase [Peribacillus butanolivorans]|uniref:serine O-acetyltransferase n=1 Tax=Peribacillus butanolivorans TaxID=421767 RepID=UPI0036ADFB35